MKYLRAFIDFIISLFTARKRAEELQRQLDEEKAERAKAEHERLRDERTEGLKKKKEQGLNQLGGRANIED